ncbi:anti-sigma factor family protein [Bdellovibrionota bacterium]
MPDCFFVGKLLSDYLDGQSDFQQQKRIQGHLLSCKSCHKLLVDLRKQQQSVQSLSMNDLPDDLQASLSKGGTWIHRFDPRKLSPLMRYFFEWAIIIGVAAAIVAWVGMRFRFF